MTFEEKAKWAQEAIERAERVSNILAHMIELTEKSVEDARALEIALRHMADSWKEWLEQERASHDTE